MVIETIGEPNDDGFADYHEPCWCCGGSGEVEEDCSETGKRNCPECNGGTQ